MYECSNKAEWNVAAYTISFWVRIRRDDEKEQSSPTSIEHRTNVNSNRFEPIATFRNPGRQLLEKMKKYGFGRNASTDTESIQIAPRDVQKLEVMHFPNFHFLKKLIKFDAD